MTIVQASWVEGFATRLMQLRPATLPLEAVRDATRSFEDSSWLLPDEAAEQFAGSVEPAPEAD